MSALLGDDLPSFLAALSHPPAGLRVNTLRLTPDDFRERAPFPIEPLPFPPEGFTFADDVRPGLHPYHAAGLYYLQDPGAMVVGALPDLPDAPRVLDLAAAPGGKATHLAARMAGEGTLVANDIHPGRAQELAGNLERMGVRNAIVTSSAPNRLAELWGGWFDLVLLDAPCSGESMFHKSPTAGREWSLDAVRGCARRQSELIVDAARLVRPGGSLIYSTCTFGPEEDEGVIDRFLREHDRWEAVELSTLPGSAPGRPDWIEPSGDPKLARAVRLWPHRFPGAGHFIAALRHDTDAPSSAPRPRSEAGSCPSGAVTLLREFLDRYLSGIELEFDRVVAAGEWLSLAPGAAPPLDGVRVLRRGWQMGCVERGRFEPAHALAMGCEPHDASIVVDLSVDSPAVASYLHGDTIRVEGPDGWVVVAVDGFPLGWGKRSRGVVKNHYPRGLRR